MRKAQARRTRSLNRALARVACRLPLAVLLLSAGGCAVFEPVGSFFAQGYRNTVAYFNTFYNAQRLFDEAESEITLALRQYERSLLTGVTTPFVVPSGARQKFTQVIDKCSNILAFHAESGYVEDALYLIGKSYQYLGEFVKAERKYSELLSYDELSYRPEVQARLGTVMYAQGRHAEARLIFDQALAGAEESDDSETIVLALENLAQLSRDDGDVAAAIRYYGRLTGLSGDDERVVNAVLEYAQLLIDEGQADDALTVVAGVSEMTDDSFLLYRSLEVEVSALEEGGRNGEAMSRVSESIEDFRFAEQLPMLKLRHAELQDALGNEDDAVAEYEVLDTTYARQEAGIRAAKALAEISEERNDYQSAKKYYDRAATVTTSETGKSARASAISVGRLLDVLTRLALSDTAWMAVRDSSGPADPRLDSLGRIRASLTQDVGEWFYSEGGKPDSAEVWLRRSIEEFADRTSAARAFFILADLKGSSSPEGQKYHRRVIEESPISLYAVESRKVLGISDSSQTNPAHELYTEAESALKRGENERAAILFDSVANAYVSSPLAEKGTYSAAWVYEYRLNRIDSAVTRYQAVMRTGKEQEYVTAARKRFTILSSSTPPDSSAADTSGNRTNMNPMEERELDPGSKKKEVIREKIE